MDEYSTPDVFPDIALGYTVIHDPWGNGTVTVVNSELRDLAKTLIALADEAGE